MNKQDLVAKVAEKAGLSKKDAEGAVSAFVDVVKETVAGGDAVQLIGFGTFASRERAAREARNPRTGEKIKIAAAKTPAFKRVKACKEAVNLKNGKNK